MSLSFLREKMLTSSSNQYLRPEYLTPLPTTLDAKKSPLALLAQTCSQIGADPPSSKSLLPSLSNSSSSSSSSSSGSTNNTNSHHHTSGSSTDGVNGNRNSSTTPNSERSSKKSGGSRKQNHSGSPNSHKSPSSSSPNSNSNSLSINNNLLVSKDNITIDEVEVKVSQRSKTPGSKGGTPVPTSTSGTASPISSSSVPPPQSSGTKSPISNNQQQSLSLSSSSSGPPEVTLVMSRSSNFENSSSVSSSHSPVGTVSSVSSSKLNLTGPDLSPLGSLKHSASVTSSLVPFPGLYPGLPPPSLSSAAGQGIPPYLHSYARLKAAAAAGGAPDPLGSLSSPLNSLGGGSSGGCRDPFCTGCQLGSGHLSGGSSGAGGKCPAGCSQCDHHKSPIGALGSGAFNGFPFFPGFPSLPPSLAGLSAAYGNPSSHSHVVSSSGLQAAQSLAVTPYVCNWVGGPDNYCGKRFASSDELFQHLRTHTSLSAVSAASECASLMERYSQAATHPLLSSAAAAAHISRTYPTPPLSPLSSARFHPYSKPGAAAAAAMGLSSLGLVGPSPNNPSSASLAATFPPPGFSALAHPLSPYYPYSFYGQRLGTSGSLHP